MLNLVKYIPFLFSPLVHVCMFNPRTPHLFHETIQYIHCAELYMQRYAMKHHSYISDSLSHRTCTQKWMAVLLQRGHLSWIWKVCNAVLYIIICLALVLRFNCTSNTQIIALKKKGMILVCTNNYNYAAVAHGPMVS